MKFNQRILASMQRASNRLAQRATTAVARQLQRSMQEMVQKTLAASSKAAAQAQKPAMRDINEPPASSPTAKTRTARPTRADAGGAADYARHAAPESARGYADAAPASTTMEVQEEFVSGLLAKLGVPAGAATRLFKMPSTSMPWQTPDQGMTEEAPAGGSDGADDRSNAGASTGTDSGTNNGTDRSSGGETSAAGSASGHTSGSTQGGRFLSGSFANRAGKRQYKLYVPSAYHGQPLPLVVMLHGCTQNPDDFAAGTRMNALAESQPCLVLYPAQERAANSSRCWNWFNAIDQKRDQGEPSIIAGMTREIMQTWHVDARQVFVAGLSAGGAMAIIMGTVYPELYAAVGVHSGLPYAAASDLPSALAAMKGGMGARAAGSRASAKLAAIPVIVFHGDRDQTVSPRNGEQVLAQAVPGAAAGSPARVERAAGHAYTRTVLADDAGRVLAEQWLVHGAGHAWSGGSASGSYTDAKGPDASAEMLRFFATRAQDAGAGASA
ncbi:MAG: extracellular catalytic domain type 1 short-chain-length polyhydroxyalkanoate depolymerase [Janthinobacterium lividum]